MFKSENTPLISIPLCTYNGAKYLAAQMDSLCNQTYRNVEIVVFDDASTDATVAILDDYARRDSRITVRLNRDNIGFKGNFMQAILACHGDFIAPCDQDDVWHADKLAILARNIGKHSLIYCDSELIDPAGCRLGRKISDYCSMIDSNEPGDFVFANCVSGHAMLFRKSLVPLIAPLPVGFYHDWWIAAVAASCSGVAYCDHALVAYRQHGANVSNMTKAHVRRVNKPEGYKMLKIREIGCRLRALSMLPGARQELLCRMARLWSLRESQWISWELCGLLLRHGPMLRRVQKKSFYRIYMDALSMLSGVRLKRLADAHGYGLELPGVE